MISKFESFLCPDKQGKSEDGRRIKQPKRYATTNNSPKIAHKILHIKSHLRNSDRIIVVKSEYLKLFNIYANCIKKIYQKLKLFIWIVISIYI